MDDKSGADRVEDVHNTIRFYNRLDAVRGEEAAALFAKDGTWYRDGDDSGWTGRAEIAAHVNRLPERGNPKIAPEEPDGFPSGDQS